MKFCIVQEQLDFIAAKVLFLWIPFNDQHGPTSLAELAPRQGHAPNFQSRVCCILVPAEKGLLAEPTLQGTCQ